MRTLFILLFTLSLNAQDGISLGVFHDAKLGLGLDKEHGNDSPTLDVILNISLEGKQFKNYYFSVVPFFEIAKLHGGDYKRYGVNLMWNFNQFKWVEIGVGAGFGIIHRPESYASYSFTADLSHYLSKTVSVVLKNEFVRRSELKTPKLGYNLSLGIKLKLIKL